MAHTVEELKMRQALPLSLKVKLTKSRIREWVNYYGEEDVRISFSGGKDSTVLLHLAREEYPHLKAVYFDTGLEYQEIRDFVKGFDGVEWVKPKTGFIDVIKKYGYPMISKEVSEVVYTARRYFFKINQEENGQKLKYSRMAIRRLCGIGEYSAQKDRDINSVLKKELINTDTPYRWRQLMGMVAADGGLLEDGAKTNRSQFNAEKYKFFLLAPFEIGKNCCAVMKKNPAHAYERKGIYFITAQMAEESRLRKEQWLRNGCNAFDAKRPISNPMSFWTEQDVLEYIKLNNIELAPVYGDVVEDGELEGQLTWGDLTDMDLTAFGVERPKYKTTGCHRTGCVFCGFGLHMEKRPNRLEMIKQVSNPAMLDFCLRGGDFDTDGLWKPGRGGLGYWFVLKWINIYGGFNIFIPDYDDYEKKYGNERTWKHLYGGGDE